MAGPFELRGFDDTLLSPPTSHCFHALVGGQLAERALELEIRIRAAEGSRDKPLMIRFVVKEEPSGRGCAAQPLGGGQLRRPPRPRVYRARFRARALTPPGMTAGADQKNEPAQ